MRAFLCPDDMATSESRLVITVDSRSAEQRTRDTARALGELEKHGLGAQVGVEQMNRALKNTEGAAGSAHAAIRRMATGAIAGVSAMQVIDMADQWGQFASRIRMATESTEEYERVQARMAKSANATYRSVNETREAFIQLSPVLRQMGMSLDQSMDAIDAFSGLLVVNAASGDRADAALRALSISLQKGKIDADSWITIYSTLDSVVDVIAKSTGKAADEIRRLGAEGKLSVQDFAQALSGQYASVMQQVEGMPTTVRDAMSKVANSFTEYIGWSNEARGITAGMADAILVLGENFDTLATVGLAAAGGALTAYAARGAVAAVQTAAHTAEAVRNAAATRAAAQASHQYAVAKLAEAQATVAASTGMQRLTAVTALLIPAQRQLTASSVALAAASRTAYLPLLGMLGGPVGLAATVGLTAAAFLTMGGNATAATPSIEELSTSIDKLTRAQLALRQQQTDELVETLEGQAQEAAHALQGLQTDYEELQQAFDDGRGVSAEGLQNVNKALVEQRAALDTANQKLDEARALQDRLGASAAAAAGGVGVLNNALAQTDEAGTKYLERLEKRALLAGKTTQVAQLNALRDAGEFKMDDAAYERALKAARALDAVAKSAGGAKSALDKLNLSSISNGLAVESSKIDAALRQLEITWNRGDMGADRYFTNRIALAEAAGAAQEGAIQKEINALNALGAKGKAGQQVREKLADAETKLAVARARNSSELATLRAEEEAYFRGPSMENIKTLTEAKRALEEQNRTLEDQIRYFGLTGSEVEKLRVARLDEMLAQQYAALATATANEASEGELNRINDLIAALYNLRNAREVSAGLQSQHEAQQREKARIEASVQSWGRGIDKIGELFVEGFSASLDKNDDAFDAFVDNAGKALKNSVATALYEATLKPIVIRFVAQMAGVLGGAQTRQGILNQNGMGGGGMDLGGLRSASGLFNSGSGAAMGTEYAANAWGSMGGDSMEALIAGNSSNWGVSSSMGSNIGAGVGYAAAIYALTEKQYATAIGTAVGTYIMPGIGTAIGSLLGNFVDGMLGDKLAGETRAGAQYGLVVDGQLYNPRRGTSRATDATGVQWLEGPSGGGDSESIRAAIEATTTSINEMFRIVGADVSLSGFWAGFEGSEKGRGGVGAGGNLSTGAAFGEGGTGSNYDKSLFDRTRARTLTAEEAANMLPAQLAQASLQAWQAAAEQMPGALARVLQGVDLSGMADDAILALQAQFVTLVTQADQLRAGLAALPFPPTVAQTFAFAAALAEAAGGAENAANQLASYYQNYYSETERAAHLTAQLIDRFAQLGYTLPQTRDEFRGLVEANMALGEGGARTTAELLAMESALSSLLPAFDAITNTIDDVAAQANAAFDAQLAKVKSLAEETNRVLGVRNRAGNTLDEIDRALGRTGKFGPQREAELWAAMATASYEQQIDLASELTSITLDRYQEEIAAAERLADLGANLRDYVAGLKIGDMSPLTLGQRLAEAGSQYAEMLARAQAGDTDAMAGLQGMADSYLRLARDYYASSDQYTQIFNSVTGGLDELGVQAQTDAERQLAVGVDSLAQLEGLRGVAQNAYAALDRQYQQSVGALERETSLLVDLGQDTGRLHDIASLLGSLPAELAARLQPFLDTATRGTVTDWYQDAGRGQGDAGGVDYWQGELGKRPESQVKDSFLWGLVADWYKDDLGRKGAESEIAYWFDEAKKKGAQSAYQDFLWGAQAELHGSHANGLAYVPFDGYRAELHRGEAVLTAAENRAYQAMPDWSSYGRGNESLIAEVRRLNDRIGQLEVALVKATSDGARAISETTARSATHIADRADEAASRASHEASIQ